METLSKSVFSYEPYPEHTKLAEVSELSQTIGDFIEWLNSQYIWLASYDKYDTLYPVYTSIPTLLAEYFHIDRGILEQEKRQMLEELRDAKGI